MSVFHQRRSKAGTLVTTRLVSNYFRYSPKPDATATHHTLTYVIIQLQEDDRILCRIEAYCKETSNMLTSHHHAIPPPRRQSRPAFPTRMFCILRKMRDVREATATDE